MNKSKCLDTAKSLICDDRHKEYGDTNSNFSDIAKIWSVVLGHKVTPKQVALCMIAVKMSRLRQNIQHEDSWVDIAGYAGCGSECKE